MKDFLWGLIEPFYNAVFMNQGYLAYAEGIKNTLLISLMAVAIGIIIGVLVAVVRVISSKIRGLHWLGKLCGIYVTVIRGTPVMVQLLIIYNMIFTSRDSNPLLCAGICFGINSGAYVAEIIRGGIESIDKGQTEAGRSLGFNDLQTMRYIILPQAFRNALPALGNEFIVLVKESSVASVIAVSDLTKMAQYIGSRTWDIVPPLVVAALCYLVIVMILTKLLSLLERRMSRGDRN
ncbi:amino acid ABC transporter permease [Diplocloster agilis]|uniref:Amino acid ABC transporter permease n=1 Tax=Diplocloster agilis TaxID=2850323 RepID=A0A949NGY2_9FIRM|nr:amino acid ABC transporter permease [Diplocloster agilis]MBU9746459.1 amino acid ABC transporter permease [Diplocloster agilis]SCJ94564.1 L-cystine transport system permease protein tcyB [uncultured Clostridium sp.]